MGLFVLVDVWLTDDEATGGLVAHIGNQRVGTIARSDATELDHAMRIAAQLDEHRYVEGRLTEAGGTPPIMLEIPLPDRPNPDETT